MIIFDLDDTLIDTSGSITPFKIGLCLKKLIDSGLAVSNYDAAYKELLDLNNKYANAKSAFFAFGKAHKVCDQEIGSALSEMTSTLPPSFIVDKTPHAIEILEFYHKKYPLALVTGGKPSFQKDKLKKAGIDSSYFSMIGIPEDSVKKPFYQALSKKFSLPPEKIWVCGDRVETDLRPAYELGFRTVHMRWGRGVLAPSEPWIDFSISTLSQLKEIIP